MRNGKTALKYGVEVGKIRIAKLERKGYRIVGFSEGTK